MSEAIDNLAAALRGELIRPGDDSYDSARAVFNGMHDRRPAAIARCANAAPRSRPCYGTPGVVAAQPGDFQGRVTIL